MFYLLQLLLWWIRLWRNGYLWLSSLVGYIWLQRCRYFIVRGLEIFAALWYNSNSKKATSERNLWFAWGGRKYGVWIATTFLTIYGFGLCGISVSKSTRKQWFQIQKYQKSLKSPYFTRLLRFGSKFKQVRLLSSRPHENNPNIFLLVEAFGLFFYLSIPTLIVRNENSLRQGFPLSEA